MHAAANDTLTILTFASSNYLHWLGHLHRNVRQLKLPTASLLVCSADGASLAEARGKGLATIDVRDAVGCSSCLLLRTERSSDHAAVVSPYEDEGASYGTPSYTQLVHAKSLCVHMHLERQWQANRQQGLLMFVDPDVTLFADPRPYFPPGADIALLLDIGPGFVSQPDCGWFNASSSDGAYLNSGLFLMRHSESTRRLWRQMIHYHEDNPTVLQQSALNTVVRNDTQLKVRGLDPRHFLSGFCFYEQLPTHVRLASPSSHHLVPGSVVAVHHNWLKGDLKKWARATQASAVLTDDAPGFVDRARASMRAGIRWTGHEALAQRSCDLLPLSPSAFPGVCRRDSPPRLCADHSPVVLWSLPGSGSTWLRLVIELATGARTSSLYGRQGLARNASLPNWRRPTRAAQERLALRMPSEVWKHATQADCAGMAAIAVHGLNEHRVHVAQPPWPHDFASPWVRTACGGTLARAIFLVRHPFLFTWASLLARRAADPRRHVRRIQSRAAGNRTAGFWSRRLHSAAVDTARQWNALINYQGHFTSTGTTNANVDWSWHLWRRSGRASVLVRLEDLQVPGRARYELRRLIDFVFEGQPAALGTNPRTRCALEQATQMHDAHRQGARILDRDQVRRALEHEPTRTGDAMWKLVAQTAEQMDYTRHGYYELLPPVASSYFLY